MHDQGVGIANNKRQDRLTINGSSVSRADPRVLHILSDYRPVFTGHGLFWEKLWPCLTGSRRVHDVLVVGTPRPDTPPKPPRSARLMYLSRTSPMRRVRKIIELELWLMRNLHRYDILHAHSHVDRFFVSHWLAYFLKIPVVYSATLDDTPKALSHTYRRLLRPYARYMLRRMDHLIAIGSHLADEAAGDIGTERVSLIHNGVKCPQAKRGRSEMRRDLGIQDDAVVLLSVCGICRRKAPDLLIKNHSRLSANGQPCHLVLVGPDVEPHYASEMRTLAEQCDLLGNVHFAGYSDEPGSFYEMADIFVFASTGEGFGNVIAEAMYMGLPVVSRYLPGTMSSLIESGKTGFLFENGAGYRQNVERLTADPHMRAKIGQAAQEWVTRELSMPTVAERYQKVYNQLFIGHPAGSL